MTFKLFGRFLARSAGIATLSLLLAVVLFHFVFQPFQVAGLSMAPALHDQDFLLVDRLFYHLSPLKRGDIVVFRSPADGRYLVKRLAALPGDDVEVRPDGSMRVNGTPSISAGGGATPPGFFTVPPGRFYCLGDNRPQSQDSRAFGFIDGASIHGRVLLRYYPPSAIPPSAAAAAEP